MERHYDEGDFKKWDKVLQTSPPLAYPFQFNTIEALLNKYYRNNSGSSHNPDRAIAQKFKMLEKTMQELDYAVSHDDQEESDQWHQRRDEEEDWGAKNQREEDLREVWNGNHEASLSMKKRAKELIPGGIADGKPDSDFDKDALAKGINIELEHTTSRDIAKEIAKDHLMEDPEYYYKLETIEASISTRDIVPNPIRKNYDYNGSNWIDRVKNRKK